MNAASSFLSFDAHIFAPPPIITSWGDRIAYYFRETAAATPWSSLDVLAAAVDRTARKVDHLDCVHYWYVCPLATIAAARLSAAAMIHARRALALWMFRTGLKRWKQEQRS
jgi:hypothetical protein